MLDITGKINVRVNNSFGAPVYSTCLTNKNANGETEYMYLNLKFVGNAKNPQLNDKTEINITKAFPSFYSDKEGKHKMQIIIQDFVYQYDNKNVFETEEYQSDDLPF